MKLRPYQEQAVADLRALYRAGKKRALAIAPTGSGKTVLFSHVAQRAVERGSRVLIIAHRRELVAQASQKLLSFGVHHGIIQAGFRPAPHQPVQVASIQTLQSRPQAATRVDLLVIDEAHHTTTSNGYATILARYPQATVLGVTATPWRLDGKGLSDVFDGHVVVSTPRKLRDEGFLVPVGGWEYEAIDTSTARVSKGDFVAKDLEASASSKRVVGDIISEWMAHAGGARTVLFALSVAQSQLIVAEFQRAGVPAEHVDGSMDVLKRDAILGRLRAGHTKVVSNCNVLTEGWDCPEAEVCILARPTLSTSLALQMVGRVLRPAPGKTMARIHDHAGILAAHGHPYAERDYSPEISVKGERKQSRDDPTGGPTQLRCPACKSVRCGWPCDACGFSPTPKELQLEFEEAAAKRAIENDGRAKEQKKETDLERREKWARRYEWDVDGTERYRFFLKMVAKHGPEKAPRIYRWVSGFSEQPRKEWRGQQLEGSAA